MTVPQSPQGVWRKASYSQQDSNCVEVRRDSASTSVRDSKNRAAGHFTVDLNAWSALLECATR